MDSKQNVSEYLSQLQERNRLKKKISAKSKEDLLNEQKERGFTTHFQGANKDLKMKSSKPTTIMPVISGKGTQQAEILSVDPFSSSPMVYAKKGWASEPPKFILGRQLDNHGNFRSGTNLATEFSNSDDEDFVITANSDDEDLGEDSAYEEDFEAPTEHLSHQDCTNYNTNIETLSSQKVREQEVIDDLNVGGVVRDCVGDGDVDGDDEKDSYDANPQPSVSSSGMSPRSYLFASSPYTPLGSGVETKVNDMPSLVDRVLRAKNSSPRPPRNTPTNTSSALPTVPSVSSATSTPYATVAAAPTLTRTPSSDLDLTIQRRLAALDPQQQLMLLSLVTQMESPSASSMSLVPVATTKGEELGDKVIDSLSAAEINKDSRDKTVGNIDRLESESKQQVLFLRILFSILDC